MSAFYPSLFLNFWIVQLNAGSWMDAAAVGLASVLAHWLGARDRNWSGRSWCAMAYLTIWLGVLAGLAADVLDFARWTFGLPSAAIALVILAVASQWNSRVPALLTVAILLASGLRLADALIPAIQRAHVTALRLDPVWTLILITAPIAYLAGAHSEPRSPWWSSAFPAFAAIVAGLVLGDAAWLKFGKKALAAAPLWVGDSTAFIAPKAFACMVTLAGPIRIGWVLLVRTAPATRWLIPCAIAAAAISTLHWHGAFLAMVWALKAAALLWIASALAQRLRRSRPA